MGLRRRIAIPFHAPACCSRRKELVKLAPGAEEYPVSPDHGAGRRGACFDSVLCLALTALNIPDFSAPRTLPPRVSHACDNPHSLSRIGARHRMCVGPSSPKLPFVDRSILSAAGAARGTVDLPVFMYPGSPPPPLPASSSSSHTPERSHASPVPPPTAVPRPTFAQYTRIDGTRLSCLHPMARLSWHTRERPALSTNTVRLCSAKASTSVLGTSYPKCGRTEN